MKEYARRREGMGETTEVVVVLGNGGLNSRAPDVITNVCSSSKRRKVSSHQFGNDGNEVLPENSVSLASFAAAVREPVTSKCSSYESIEDLRNIDLMKYNEDSVTDNSGSMNNGVRETSPSSELCGDSVAEMESSSSTAKKESPETDSRRKLDGTKMPSAAEIEEFFSATEKYAQKRFAEKYNYDIVMDVPLEGSYQWVRLKP